MSTPVDWDAIARKQGYSDPVRMVVEMYYLEEMSLNEVCDRLIISTTALLRFMDLHNLPRKDWTKSIRRTRWVNEGPRCPSCGSTRSKVIQTFPGEPYRRYRRCKECKRYFLTKEIPGQEDIFSVEVLTKRAEDE